MRAWHAAAVDALVLSWMSTMHLIGCLGGVIGACWLAGGFWLLQLRKLFNILASSKLFLLLYSFILFIFLIHNCILLLPTENYHYIIVIRHTRLLRSMHEIHLLRAILSCNHQPVTHNDPISVRNIFALAAEPITAWERASQWVPATLSFCYSFYVVETRSLDVLRDSLCLLTKWRYSLREGNAEARRSVWFITVSDCVRSTQHVYRIDGTISFKSNLSDSVFIFLTTYSNQILIWIVKWTFLMIGRNRKPPAIINYYRFLTHYQHRITIISRSRHSNDTCSTGRPPSHMHW